MKYLLKIVLYCVLQFLLLHSCAIIKKRENTPESVEKATKLIKKEQRRKKKHAQKVQKMAYKAFWEQQTKQARRSIKQNKRRQLKIERARKKSKY
jgi:hypothetical protein